MALSGRPPFADESDPRRRVSVMSLRPKLTWIIAAIVAAYALADWVVQRSVIYPSFEELERVQAQRNLQRVFEALENEVEHLDGLVLDWASWDDSYEFVQRPNPAYVQGNLTETTLENNDLCLIYFVDTAGAVVWRVFRPDDLGLVEFPDGRRPSPDPLGAALTGDAPVRGFLSTSQGLLFFASRPILKSDQNGPTRGRLLMARRVDEVRLAGLRQQVRLPFSIHLLEREDELDEHARAAQRSLAAGGDVVLTPADDGNLAVFGALSDFRGAPLGLVEARVSRDVTLRGQRALDYALVTTLLAALVVLGVVLFLLQRTVVAPLQELTAHAEDIGRHGDLEARCALRRDDEIGVLAREFDGMVAELAKSRAASIAMAHQAGMSEIAVQVLHDVGNVLNSVNVAVETIERQAGASRVDDVARIGKDLGEHGADLARFLAEGATGKRYPAYLEALGSALAHERSDIQSECRLLSESVAHVRHLVTEYQQQATRDAVVESVSLAEQVETALRIARWDERAICVDREFDELPRVPVARHKLLQILLNLLKNARESLAASGVAKPAVRIALHLRPDERVELSVTDNGAGIAPEHRERLFTQGFTTKSDGHGVGLHGAANAARELGGALTATSPGPGRGATFVLELPVTLLEARAQP